ncbi:DUF7681 family protein [Cerasicoccus frondis]|uniref:Acb2/Tad1 domain-containing protein n=1 Tax=Cerasicoccus frondis TaxID=490090 RepID=UPI0028527F17|nr:hypothetical protein [Cerasicoccus frondis]
MEKSSSSRKLTDHKVPGLNEAIEIEVLDQPGPGGANHIYRISGYSHPVEVVANSETGETEIIGSVATEINFQNGPIREAGFNGLSNEALLAVVIDRLRGFQHGRKESLTADGPVEEFDFSSRGRFACRENALALTHIEEAMMWLQKRTTDRMKRGVEGTHQR